MPRSVLPGFAVVIAAFGLSLGALQVSGAQAQSWPTVSEQALQKYLFTDGGSGEQRLQRWESDMVLDFYFSSGKPFMKDLVKEFNDRHLLGDRQVHLMPPADLERAALVDRFGLALGVSEDFYNLTLETEQIEHGRAVYVSHARRTGCFARSVVRSNGGQEVITGGKIIVREDLSREELRDCLLRGMLLSAGLQHTRELAYDVEPMSDVEREEAFDVLQLLYHPSVRSGMTRQEFTQALRAQGLVK